MVKDSTSWGRVELSQTTSDSKTDNFLNVIAVADNDKEITFSAKRVVGLNDDGNALLEGASFGSVTAMFANKSSRVSEEMSFVTEGDGLIEYYISGLYTGTWTVSVGGAGNQRDGDRSEMSARIGGPDTIMIIFTANIHLDDIVPFHGLS